MSDGTASGKTMRVWVVPEHGGLEVLRIEDRPVPEPKAGEVRIRTVMGALNHLDLWVRKGIVGHEFPLPIVPISDVAGVVDKVGAEVNDLKEGDRVVLIPGVSCQNCGTCFEGDDPLCRDYRIRGETFDGGAAEYVVVPKNEAIPISANLDWQTAAAFGLTFLTAYRMIHTRAKVQMGEWVLVHAAGSGVSSAAIQLALLAGARVIATAGNPEKIKAAEAFGVEHIINYKEKDFSKEIRNITGKRGVDVIIDHIGKDTFEGNIRSLAKGGRLVFCGNTSGAFVEANLAMIFYKGLSILGSTMGSRAEFLKCVDIVERGLAKPVIDSVWAFEDLPKAQEHLENRKAFGKVLLRIGQG